MLLTVNCKECRSFLNIVILIDQQNEFWSDLFYNFDLLCQVHLALAQVWKRGLTVTPSPYSQSTVCPFSYCQMRSAATAVFMWNPCAKIFSFGVGHIGDSVHRQVTCYQDLKKDWSPASTVMQKPSLTSTCIFCLLGFSSLDQSWYSQ